MSVIKKILIINTIIAGVFLLGIGRGVACESDAECKKSNPDTPICTATGQITTTTEKKCQAVPFRNPAPAQTICKEGYILINNICRRLCNETLVLTPQKPTQQPAQKPQPSLPAINPFINFQISCLATVVSRHSEIAVPIPIIHACAFKKDISQCLSYHQITLNISDEELTQALNKCRGIKASVFDTLWNFVTHRK